VALWTRGERISRRLLDLQKQQTFWCSWGKPKLSNQICFVSIMNKNFDENLHHQLGKKPKDWLLLQNLHTMRKKNNEKSFGRLKVLT
jgi:hypothetical protein